MLHADIDPHSLPIRLLGCAIDDAAAVWVLPGEEFNRGPYWRVYDTVVAYGIGRHRGSFSINTMISWRGEWYEIGRASCRERVFVGVFFFQAEDGIRDTVR
jgi:hypothetical protein